MKKISKLALLIPMLLLTSCNKQLFDFNQKFEKVHVFETGKCYDISSWTDYEDGDQIQVTIKGKGACLFHSSQICLVEKDCPFCDK